MRKTLITLALAATTLFAADLSGDWKGSVNRPSGEKETDVIMKLKHDGEKITGSIGVNESEMAPIDKVTLAENKLTFEVPTGSATFKITLDADGDTLKGSVIREADGQPTPPLPMELKRAPK